MAQPATILISVLSRPDISRRKKYIDYTVQLADPGAPTYPALGIVVDLTTVTNPKGYERAKWASPDLPGTATGDAEQLSAPQGFLCTLEQAAANPTMKNFVLRIWTAPGTELGTGAGIPAGLFAALIANAPKIVFRLRQRNFQ